MTAQDYKITFPYNATTAPYSVVRPHKGNDRKMPVGVPVVINSVVVAYSGQTGSYNGVPNLPHLHTQAGTDQACQNTVDPTPFEFKPGTVVALRTTNENQWGKYITIKTLSGMYITYAHLSQINVTVGQVIGGNMPSPEEVEKYFRGFRVPGPSIEQLAVYTKAPLDKLLSDLLQYNFDRRTEAEQRVRDLEANPGSVAATPEQVAGGRLVSAIREVLKG